MLTVYKYSLETINEQTISLPKGATLLHFAEQHGGYCLWALVDLGQIIEPRRIWIAGTGHNIGLPAGSLAHISTSLAMDGNLVLHAFEILPA